MAEVKEQALALLNDKFKCLLKEVEVDGLLDDLLSFGRLMYQQAEWDLVEQKKNQNEMKGVTQ